MATVDHQPETFNSIRVKNEPSSIITNIETNGSGEFTEVFSWGSDTHGQLGLGKKDKENSRHLHQVPRFCSYNIPINMISCGEQHSVFITSKS
jgi:alpha-tubulin suppressor-like RCC1 family protein